MGVATPPTLPDDAPAQAPRRGAAVALTVAIVVVAFAAPVAYTQYLAGVTTHAANDIPIDHIVIVMMENHPYDNLFGTYCTATGPNCPQAADGIPPGECVPIAPGNPAAGCVRPFDYGPSNQSVRDLSHIYRSTVESINGGAMDGFYAAEGNTTEPFGHYNGSLIPIAWDLAEEYALGDDFFSSALSYSLPNHWYLLAGQVPQNGVNQSGLATNASRHVYLNSANRTETVQDLLNASPQTTWKYYDWALESYQTAISANIGGSGLGDGSAYNYWNPLAARYESYTSWYVNHFVPRSDFFSDASSGNLPDVSWVIPDPSFSDHPPANMTAGEAFIADIVDSVEMSPEWNSTAIFVSWDDYGGFWDHVPPPYLDPLGLSIRVPLLVISPYTPAGLVVHDLGYFESLLRFVEWRFDLGCITPRDCLAPLPLGYFDFGMHPRPPILFPNSVANATYPMGGTLPYESAVSVFDAGPPGCSEYCFSPTEWNTGPPLDQTVTDID